MCESLCSCVYPLSDDPNGVQRFCYINQMLIQRMPGVSLTVGQVAPSSWVLAASLAPGITSALRPHSLAHIHLLATCLWSFSHLAHFASHQTKHHRTCLVATYCTVIPPHLLISYELLLPSILSSNPNCSPTALCIINHEK